MVQKRVWAVGEKLAMMAKSRPKASKSRPKAVRKRPKPSERRPKRPKSVRKRPKTTESRPKAVQNVIWSWVLMAMGTRFRHYGPRVAHEAERRKTQLSIFLILEAIWEGS